jgi:hypothetical protein
VLFIDYPITVPIVTIPYTFPALQFSTSPAEAITFNFPMGALQVTINPAGAVSAGAKWQVDGGAWQNSGATVSGLSVGTHTVGFKSISGWSTPGNQAVTISSGSTIMASGTYTSPGRPDFIVTSISLSPSSPQPGQAFTAYVTVKNQGSASGSGGWLAVWKNQPSTQACGATGDSYQSVGTLAAGASSTFTFSGLTAPAASGSYTFRAFVDSGCTTAESNENNNQTTLGYTVIQPAQSDLTKGTDNLSNLSPYPGDVVTVSITVQNQSCSGGSASAGAFHIGFYWSTSSSFSGVSPFLETAVSGCSANGTVSISQNITINSTTTPGTYYLGYKIDDQNEVAECNENNNGIFHWTVNVQ